MKMIDGNGSLNKSNRLNALLLQQHVQNLLTHQFRSHNAICRLSFSSCQSFYNDVSTKGINALNMIDDSRNPDPTAGISRHLFPKLKWAVFCRSWLIVYDGPKSAETLFSMSSDNRSQFFRFQQRNENLPVLDENQLVCCSHQLDSFSHL